MEPLQELLANRAKLIANARKILDAADAEKRDLKPEERETYDKLETDIEALSDKIEARAATDQRRERHKKLDELLAQPAPRQVASGEIGGKDGGEHKKVFKFGRAGKIDLANLQRLDRRSANQLLARATEQYVALFASYLMGDKRNFEELGLMVSDDTQGGYTAPMAFVSMLIKFLDDAVQIRRLATVLPPTTATSVGVLSYDADPGDADWTPEVPASAIAEDTAARFGHREMTPHLLSKLIKASTKLLRSSAMPIEEFLAGRLGYKFGITENKAFLSGSGAQQPLGLFTPSNDGIPTSQDTTASAPTTFNADDLINVKESIKTIYQEKATWIVSRAFRKACRKLKDGIGNYLLVENNAGGIATLLDRPLVVDENAPNTFTTGKYIAVFGDISFYWIQDGINLEVQRLDELLALTNQVGWVGRKETDGMPVLAEAFGRLVLA